MKSLVNKLSDNEKDFVELVKEFLMKKYNVNTWEDCIDKQKFGDCEKICKMIGNKFPGLFDCMYDIYIDYSPIAIKKLNDNGDTGDMYGNHYVLCRDHKLYDFCKGTNSIDGIYLLTQFDDMRDKYKIRLSSKELKTMTDKIKRCL